MTLAPFMHRAVVGFPLDTLPNQMDSTLNQFFGNTGRSTYPVDIREDSDHFYVEAELPGFKKDEVEITLENNQLTISAERRNPVEPKGDSKAEKQSQSAEWLLSERRVRTFQRSFELPPTVDGGNVSASMADGVLSIVLNKRQETKPRKIAVG